LGFENFSKKSCFLDFQWEKPISPLSPVEKFWCNPLVVPSGKTPFDAHEFKPNIFKQTILKRRKCAGAKM